jgi:uncharacterized membrane protein
MTATTRADTPDRPWLRAILALLFITSGVLHLILPGPYRGIMPSYLPAPALLVSISGVAEIAGGVGLLWPATRRAAGWGLLLLLLAVFPANVEMLRLYKARGVSGLGESLLWLRLPLQALLMWGVWRVSRRRTG